MARDDLHVLPESAPTSIPPGSVTTDLEVPAREYGSGWWEWLKKSEHGLAIFIRNGTLAGLGFVLMLWSESLPGIWLKLVEHIGMGLVVAAVAVFSYEHRAQLKKVKAFVDSVSRHTTATVERMTQETTAQLNRMIGETDKQVDQLTTLLQGKSSDAVPEALKKAFEQCALGGEFYELTLDLVVSIQKLGSRKSWVDEVSLRFIQELLISISTNAKKLAGSSNGYSFTLKLPRSASFLGDKILAEEMKKLGSEDSYTVVSDFASWKGELQSFFDESVSAAGRGATIRRVFCRFGTDIMTESEANEVLKKHWTAARESFDGTAEPHFQVAVVPKRDLEKLAIHPKHRGVFQRADHGVSFEPEDGTLAEMRFEVVEAGTPFEMFEQLWRNGIRSADKSDVGGVVTWKVVELSELQTRLGEGWW